MQPRIIGLISILIVAAGATSARAQVLADRAPADTIFYAGGAGADAIVAADQGTHLQSLLNHSDLPALVNQFLPQLMDKIGLAAPQAADVTRLVKQLAPPFWHHPHAVVFAGINSKLKLPKLALYCAAGPDAAKLEETLNEALQQAPMPVKPVVSRDGDLVVLSLGFDSPQDASVPAGGAESLANQPMFKDAMGQVDSAGLSVAYIDVARVFKLIDALPPEAEQFKQMVPQILAAAGLDDVKALALSQNFDGKDWTEKAFVAAPAPRSGLLSIGGQPLDESILKLAPMTSTRVAAGDLDLGQAFDALRASAVKFNPSIGKMVDQQVDQANQMLGINVRNDVLGSFGPDWVAYTDPDSVGQGSLGAVLANRPRDPAKLEASLTKLEQFADAMSSNFLSAKHVELQIRQATVNGVTIHYLGVPLLQPAWAIKDGVWYFAVYPSVLATALDGLPGGKSILDNSDFAALKTRLAEPGMTGIQFVDVPKLAPQSYQGWLMLSSIAGGGDLVGAPAPVMLLPKLRDLEADLIPIGTVTWDDAAGLHFRTIEAFPGSSLFGNDSMSAQALGNQLTSLSTILPGLARTRSRHVYAVPVPPVQPPQQQPNNGGL